MQRSSTMSATLALQSTLRAVVAATVQATALSLGFAQGEANERLLPVFVSRTRNVCVLIPSIRVAQGQPSRKLTHYSNSLTDRQFPLRSVQQPGPSSS